MIPRLSPSSYKILVVDDEPLVTELIELVLKTEGYGVQAVNSGTAALNKLESDRFDLIITDYNMPGMNGVELARSIKSRKPHQPIILTSGDLSGVDPSELSRHLIDAVLAKPLPLQSLRSSVRALLEEL